MKNRAFTLIELLVVVLIIGILTAIAVPKYQKAVDKSNFTQLRFVAHAIANAEQAYYLAHGKYASNLRDLDISFPQGKYGNYYANGDKITFDWGSCSLSYDLSLPACSLKSPRVSYFVKISGKDRHCVAETASERALSLCSSEMVGAKKYNAQSGYCSYPCTIFYYNSL